MYTLFKAKEKYLFISLPPTYQKQRATSGPIPKGQAGARARRAARASRFYGGRPVLKQRP